MKIEETIQEIMKDYPTQKIGLDDFYGRQTVINMLNKAINYNRCSLQLKDYSEQTFEDWLRVNKYTYDSYRMYKDENNDFVSQGELERHYKKELNL